VATYEVQFSVGTITEEVKASHITQSEDGTWLVFSDDEGEVRRFKTAAVYGVKRVDK